MTTVALRRRQMMAVAAVLGLIIMFDNPPLALGECEHAVAHQSVTR
jgi:hypothetical protein